MKDPVDTSARNGDEEAKERGFGCGGLLLVTLLAPILAHFVVGTVFGRLRMDSASLWGLAPVAHLFFFVLCLPLLWLTYGVSLSYWRRGAYPPNSPSLWAAVTAMLVYLVAVSVFWWLRGGEKIPMGI